MPTKTIHIPMADGRADVFAAFPEHRGPVPGVLMYPDAFGIRPVLRDMAEKLAAHGYYVLVPNIFYRHGPAPLVALPAYIGEEARPDIVDRLMPLVHQHTAERTGRDADAYLRFLAGQPEVKDGPIGVVGYCIGGLLATRTAAHSSRVAAVAAFHGPVGTDGTDELAKITGRVHFGHAASDLTPQALNELNTALEAARLDYTSEIYPGTIHGFTMADTDAFDAVGSERHWEHLLALLALLDSALTST
ncbi:dienelactone hydrolase [Rhodococcus sp. 06-235-1A]|uniref:dienelactone hydrolase family protein n=1 Tax=Rhodococcus sp. 06-235-1A TaxID=2022508 RepID=UPI000B9AC0B0|nr:dienelactone hydrolase family protein [Rhodococcus sp. 06-235-1A]OZD04841.1 dienelactone hydrolase [Rhodococcus sp. 06-235-1A]